MVRQSSRSIARLVVGAALLLAPTACDPDNGAGVTGLLTTPRADLSQYGSAVVVRAVPDHIDGFAPTRPYTGERALTASCPLEHTEFPVDYFLFGDDDEVFGSPRRWLLLAWITDDESDTWVGPGQLYGTTTFEFDRGSNGSSWADGVFVDLDQVFGGPTRE